MNDKYLWDRSGPRDPEVERLENALSALSWQKEAASPAESEIPSPVLRGRWTLWAWVAGLLLALMVRWQWPEHSVSWEQYPWETLAGKPQQQGNRLILDHESRARVRVGDIGSIVLEPGSQIRIDAPQTSGPGSDADYFLHLESGSLAASIFAAPRLFQVGTPSGIAVDLGCIYTATVEQDGSTTLSVVSGRVSFEAARRQVFVPAGAVTRAWPSLGPGTPVWQHKEQSYREAVHQLDRGQDQQGWVLQEVLKSSTADDSLSLWHLLKAPLSLDKTAVFERLAELYPPPDTVTLKGCLDGNTAMLEHWRSSFDWAH